MVTGDSYHKLAEKTDELLKGFGHHRKIMNTIGFWCRKYNFWNNDCIKCDDAFVCPGNYPRSILRKDIREKEFTEGFAPNFDWVLMQMGNRFDLDKRLNSHLLDIRRQM